MNIRWHTLREPEPLTVSELTAYISELFDGDELLQDVAVRGEIYNFKRHRSGHLYFTLKDEHARLRCVCFRPVAATINFEPRDGMQVVASGRVSVYEPQGLYELIVLFMRPDGLGALRAAFEKLYAKLEAEGLFDESRKRSLPRFPRCIALVTSPTGAAVRDLVTIIGRRFPLARMIIVPTLVQGDRAADSIVHSLRTADSIDDVDLIIFGRGGGSAEDLWPFNEERVARAVFACKKPTISAVGHETDLTIADLVADARAATPSAAAELAVPDKAELLRYIANLRRRAATAASKIVEALRGRHARIAGRRPLAHPRAMLEARELRVAGAEERAIEAMERALAEWSKRLAVARASLQAHRPERTLARWADTCASLRRRAREAIASLIADRRSRVSLAAAKATAYGPQRAVEQSRLRLQAAARACRVAAGAALQRRQALLAALRQRLSPTRLRSAAVRARAGLVTLRRRCAVAASRAVGQARMRLEAAQGRLKALDPRAVLERGYSVTMLARTDAIVRDAGQIQPEDALRIILARGEIEATARATRPEARWLGPAGDNEE